MATTNTYLNFNGNCEEADQLFNALAQDGQITMSLDNTFWGDYFGMLTDKFGVNWMMSYNEQQQQ